MITKQIKDENGNVLHEEHDDGYYEDNKYDSDNKLIRTESHYSNGLIETEYFTKEEGV